MRMVHGGQEFVWASRSARATRSAPRRRSGLSAKGGRKFYVFESVSKNQEGAEVVRGTWTTSCDERDHRTAGTPDKYLPFRYAGASGDFTRSTWTPSWRRRSASRATSFTASGRWRRWLAVRSRRRRRPAQARAPVGAVPRHRAPEEEIVSRRPMRVTAGSSSSPSRATARSSRTPKPAARTRPGRDNARPARRDHRHVAMHGALGLGSSASKSSRSPSAQHHALFPPSPASRRGQRRDAAAERDPLVGPGLCRASARAGTRTGPGRGPRCAGAGCSSRSACVRRARRIARRHGTVTRRRSSGYGTAAHAFGDDRLHVIVGPPRPIAPRREAVVRLRVPHQPFPRPRQRVRGRLVAPSTSVSSSSRSSWSVSASPSSVRACSSSERMSWRVVAVRLAAARRTLRTRVVEQREPGARESDRLVAPHVHELGDLSQPAR